ncbi:hypothetical protein [Roseovarius sp. E0-M6]|uniref:hypothetical protein n=1 Tax=Roseovarius sp. E0-M6 TaxID=3127118 RepID=UPI0030101E43
MTYMISTKIKATAGRILSRVGLCVWAILISTGPSAAQSNHADRPVVLCGTDAGFDLHSLRLLSGTGTPSIDRALIEELQAQSAFFGVRPAFYVYAQGIQNAMATQQTFPSTPGTDGTILYQLDLLEAHLTSARFGGSIVSGVIAHEFSHILQMQDQGIFDRLQNRHDTVKFLELHADFMAGYYMGTKFSQQPDDLDTLSRKIFELGDNNFTNIGHHGTPQERHVALRAGFRYYLENPTRDIAAALTEGEAFVTDVFPNY